MGSANGRRRYNVTSSFIGRAHTQNDTCCQINNCDPKVQINVTIQLKNMITLHIAADTPREGQTDYEYDEIYLIISM